ncbi:MAG: hypothetical protein IPJ28_09720 [Betaproteobacteria bacterium]|nr:hypothetical protein [Betaproteobacteria bacterium]
MKWPNDLVAHWKKLAGILVETSGDLLGPTAAVVGVGVTSARRGARADRPAGHRLRIARRRAAPRNALLAELVATPVDDPIASSARGSGAFRADWPSRGTRMPGAASRQPSRPAPSRAKAT